MATGITVNANCTATWSDMKLKHKFMFVTFKVENDREVVVDKFGDKDSTYENFVASMPANDCRYAVLEVPGSTKIVFIMWAPDAASIKQKMIYASTRQGLNRVSHPQHNDNSQAVAQLRFVDFEAIGYSRYLKRALACLEEPWLAFRDVRWVVQDLKKVLLNLKDDCTALSRQPDPSENHRMMVLFLCIVMSGLAAAWDYLLQSSDILEPFPGSSSQEILTIDPPLFNDDSKDSSRGQVVDIESSVISSLGSVIEMLSMITTSLPLVSLVLQNTNNSLLFFESLGIPDSRLRYDTLLLIHSLLCGGSDKVNPQFVQKPPSSVEPKKSKSVEIAEAQKFTSIIEHALVRSPHAIGNLMSVLEDSEVEVVVRNQCLNVFLILTDLGSDLKTITTFQSLPEILLTIACHEFSENEISSTLSDASPAVFDCLGCISNLFKESAAPKYFHQAGLMTKVLDLLSLIVFSNSNRDASKPRIPKCLNLILKILRTFLLTFDPATKVTAQGSSSQHGNAEVQPEVFEARRKLFFTAEMMNLLVETVDCSFGSLSGVSNHSLARPMKTELIPGVAQRVTDVNIEEISLSTVELSMDILKLVCFKCPEACTLLLSEPLSTDEENLYIAPLHSLCLIAFRERGDDYLSLQLAELLTMIVSSTNEIQETLMASLTPSPSEEGLNSPPSWGQLILSFLNLYVSKNKIVDRSALREEQESSDLDSVQRFEPFDQGQDGNYTLASGLQDYKVHEGVWLGLFLLGSVFFRNKNARELGFGIPVTLPEENAASKSFSDLVVSVLDSLTKHLYQPQWYLKEITFFAPAATRTVSCCFYYSSSKVHFEGGKKSALTSVVGLLQLMIIWAEENELGLSVWLNDLRFMPNMIDLLVFEPSASDMSQIQTALCISEYELKFWVAALKGLAAYLCVCLLSLIRKSNPERRIMTVSATELVSALQRRGVYLTQLLSVLETIDRHEVFVSDQKRHLFYGSYFERMSVNEQFESLFRSFKLAKPIRRSRIFHPELCIGLHEARTGLQPFLVKLYLETQQDVAYLQPVQAVPSAGQLVNTESLTDIVKNLKQVIEDQEEGLKKLSEENRELTDELHDLRRRQLHLDETDLSDLKKQNAFLIKETKKLKQELVSEMTEAAEAQQRWGIARRQAQERQIILESQLKGVVKALEQLEQGKGEVYDGNAVAVSSELNAEQINKLLELLGLLHSKIPGVKDFYKTIGLDFQSPTILAESFSNYQPG